MGSKYLLLLFKNICNFLLEFKVFLFVLILHRFLHEWDIILNFLLLICFFTRQLFLNFKLLSNLILLFRVLISLLVRVTSIDSFLHRSRSHRFLRLFFFRYWLLSFWLLFFSLFYYLFHLLLLSLCVSGVYCGFWRCLIWRNYCGFLCRYWFCRSCLLFLFLNVFSWIYLLNVLFRKLWILLLTFVLLIVLLHHFIVHVIQLRIILKSISISKSI